MESKQQAARTIGIDDIVPSKTNPRKSFNDAAMQELIESIKEKGIVFPILVRTIGGSKCFEVVDGERRYRAAQNLKLKEIPAEIRVMSDEEAEEAQMISFEQDADIHPLEKAEALKRMFPKFPPLIPDIIKLAGKLGKSISYIEQQLKLLDLIEPAQKAFLANRFSLEHAVQVARLQPVEQERCLTFMLKTWQEYEGLHKYFNKRNPEVENFTDQKKQEDAPTACSVKDLKDFIAQRIHLDLINAAFPMADSTLFDKAGSCIDCPKRSGFNKDLFNDITKADICTDPGCYAVKQEAFTARLKSALKKDKKKYVEITRDRIKPAGHPGAMTERNFKYVKGKPCQFTRIGVYIDTDSKGKTAAICSAKKDCRQHFGELIKEKAGRGSNSQREPQENYKVQEEKREAREKSSKKKFAAIIGEMLNRIPKALPKGWEETIAKNFENRFPIDLRSAFPKGLALSPIQKINLFLLCDDYILNVDWQGNIHPDLYKAAKKLGVKYEPILQKIADDEKAEKQSEKAPELKAGVCRICGCTKKKPCTLRANGYCSWTDETKTLCNNPDCVKAAAQQKTTGKPAPSKKPDKKSKK